MLVIFNECLVLALCTTHVCSTAELSILSKFSVFERGNTLERALLSARGGHGHLGFPSDEHEWKCVRLLTKHCLIAPAKLYLYHRATWKADDNPKPQQQQNALLGQVFSLLV